MDQGADACTSTPAERFPLRNSRFLWAENSETQFSARIATLDLMRGIAVLGILAINIAGFAGPSAGALSPNLPAQGTFADNLAYSFGFLLFEGKMRAIFAVLFGAGIVLFQQRQELAGRDAENLQVRRLFWLIVFGWMHYLFLWWGDILFVYGVCGIAVLLMRTVPTKALLGFSLLMYLGWSAWGSLDNLPAILQEESVRLGRSPVPDRILYGIYSDNIANWVADERLRYSSGFIDIFLDKVHSEPAHPWATVASSLGEILPLMLLGFVLQRSGFFERKWPHRLLKTLAIGSTVLGLSLTIATLAWLWPRGFPPAAMNAALLYGMAIPHLLMAFGYMAALVLLAPRIVQTGVGKRLTAAGRMAFSNYIGTSIVMTAVFYGWGLGLYEQVAPASQWLFVLLGWSLMLLWSEPWLRQFRQGPLEWLWRSLVMGTFAPIRRRPV